MQQPWRQNRVTWTHLPSGLSASVEFHGRRPLHRASNLAKCILAAMVARQIEGGGNIATTLVCHDRVRSWHLHTYLGVAPFVKDERTGKRTEIAGKQKDMIPSNHSGEFVPPDNCIVSPYDSPLLNPTIDQGKAFEQLLRDRP